MRCVASSRTGSSWTNGGPTSVVCDFSSINRQWMNRHNEDMYPHIMSKISWPIWIHAHKNVISCQLFAHVMGDFHGGNMDTTGVFMDASAWRL